VTNHPNKILGDDSWFDRSCFGHQSLQCLFIFLLWSSHKMSYYSWSSCNRQRQACAYFNKNSQIKKDANLKFNLCNKLIKTIKFRWKHRSYYMLCLPFCTLQRNTWNHTLRYQQATTQWLQLREMNQSNSVIFKKIKHNYANTNPNKSHFKKKCTEPTLETIQKLSHI